MCKKNRLNIAAAIVLLLISVTVNATSIQKIGFSELSALSEVIFEGEVTQVESRWNQQRSRIYTFVTFRVDDVIKGNDIASQLELRFSGGVIGAQNMVYEGMVYPAVGENGIYFVETLQRPLVNPLVGWSQGHYKIQSSKVMTNQGRPVQGIQPNFKKTVGEISEGAAGGVRLGSIGADAMNVRDFKNAIRATLPEE